MTEQQKETLNFYTTNDYLLINGLLWGEGEDTIDAFIHIINQDGLAVMKEAVEMGFDIEQRRVVGGRPPLIAHGMIRMNRPLFVVCGTIYAKISARLFWENLSYL